VPLFSILTLFPDALEAYLEIGVVGTAIDKGLVDVRCIDFRDWTRDRHRTVDDRPFGGGPGMVLKPEPLVECVEWVEARTGPHRRLVLDPAGRPFRQADAEALANEPRTMLLCGRYEGFDARVYDELDLEPVSVGDFVLAGGELPALSIVEAAARLVPGVLGNEDSAAQDSFSDPDALDHLHYTRPRVWRGREVPDVLLQGDHQRIAAWRRAQAEARTQARRGQARREDQDA
jgi:tRNA (guanine37-N1)-methyltransferase